MGVPGPDVPVPVPVLPVPVPVVPAPVPVVPVPEVPAPVPVLSVAVPVSRPRVVDPPAVDPALFRFAQAVVIAGIAMTAASRSADRTCLIN